MNKRIFFSDNIFVAGSRGMAGASICKALYQSGYGQSKFGGSILSPSRSELDLTNKISVEKWFQKNKPEVVILAAAKVGGILANSTYPTEFLLDNLKIQINVIETAWKNNVRRLLFLGSSCIYPKFAPQPIKEEYLLTSELESSNLEYALSKISGIKLCEALRNQYGFDAISLMPTNLYGPGDNYHPTNSHVMASLLMKFCNAKKKSFKSVTCWGSGKPLREFLHVEDLGKAVVFSLENWDPSNESAPKDIEGKPLNYLNVGTGKDISIYELVQKIKKETGYKGEIIWDKSKPDGTPKKQLNIEKLVELGWKPTISLDDGIKRTVKELMN